MISATSINAPSTLSKGHGHPMPIGLDSGRLRMDSQKFLVPSLPVSARGTTGNQHSSDPKRRERSIVNGTAHPAPADYSSHHNLSHPITGVRPPLLGHVNGGRESSPNSVNNRISSSPHHSYISTSPRKDVYSPVYVGEIPGLSPGTGTSYSRSSMPSPCSSPAQASSASPKGSHSVSPSRASVGAGSYSPKLPSGPTLLPPIPTGMPELNAMTTGRLYPGFPPPHPSVLGPAFYAAAAAAAASHPLPYQIFGNPYNPHSHSTAAANAYLESFHSALIQRGSSNNEDQRMRSRSRSPSPSPPNRSPSLYHSTHTGTSQGLAPRPTTTSVTNLHNKLIESTVVSSGRHLPYDNHHHMHHQVPSGPFSPHHSPLSGISNGGPLGISGGILNLHSASHHKGGPQPENLVMHNKPPILNGYHHPTKQWMEQEAAYRRSMGETEGKEMRLQGKSQLTRRPTPSPPREPSYSPKSTKSISFASDAYMSKQMSHSVQHHLSFIQLPDKVHNGSQPNSGILTDSKKEVNAPNNHFAIPSPFRPPSPKKSSAHWNFAVPSNPASKGELPPPQVNNTDHHPKYLNPNHGRPSNQHIPNSSLPYLVSGQSAQTMYPPSSPRLPGSGPSTPKSPSVHQVKFTFSKGSTKENVRMGGKAGRNDSSSSSSSNEGHVPWPVEQMPILEAFRRGSLIRLASGELRPVEQLRAEDFVQCVAKMAGSLKIIHCTVLSIQPVHENNGTSTCKVTMAVSSHLQNQQVVVPSSPEQPFFVMGRGWSSLSPKLTEKMLQLPCSTLAVGDVCITLSRSTVSSSSSVGDRNQVPKSPSTRGRKPGNGRGVASSSVKRHYHQTNVSIGPILSQKNLGDRKVSPSVKEPAPLNAVANASGRNGVESPPTNSKDPETLELRPPSPKRRRWSAPEPEVLVPSSAEPKIDKTLQKGSKETLEPIPSPSLHNGSSLPSVPITKDESENTPTVSDNKQNEEPETDVNSNVNVKDSTSGPSSNSSGGHEIPDAQPIKA